MKRVLKVLGIILSTILLIPMFVIEFLLIANIVLNTLVSSDNLSKTLEQLMTYNSRSESVLITYASTNTYGNSINYSSIEGKIQEYLIQAGFNKEEAKEIVEDEEFKKVVTDYLESVVMNKIKDSDIRYPTKDEIKSFVKKNYSKLKKVKVIDEKYTEENIDDFVEENYEEVKTKLAEVEEQVNIPDTKGFEEFKKLINLNPYMLGLYLIIIIGLIMLFRMSYYKWLAWVSLPTLLNGIIYSSLGLFGMKIITSLVNLEKYEEIIDPIAKKMSTLMIRYGIVLTIITIVMIVTYFVVKNNLKNKKTTKKVKKAK